MGADFVLPNFMQLGESFWDEGILLCNEGTDLIFLSEHDSI